MHLKNNWIIAASSQIDFHLVSSRDERVPDDFRCDWINHEDEGSERRIRARRTSFGFVL
jgi:hypothetical protein